MKPKSTTFVLLLMAAVAAKAQVPSPRHSFTVSRIDNVYYIFGGMPIDNKKSPKGSPFNDIYSYVPETKTFKKLGTTTAPGCEPVPGMDGHTAMVYDAKLYVFNGTRSEANDATYVFDNSTWFQKSNPPFNSKEYAYFSNWTQPAQNNPIGIIAGGRDVNTKEPSNECWKYNPQTDQWTQLPLVPSAPRYGGVAAQFFTKFYMFGGMTEYGPTQQALLLDLKNNTWKMLNPTGYMIHGIYGMISDMLGTNMYLWGGEMWTYAPYPAKDMSTPMSKAIADNHSAHQDMSFSTSLYEFQIDTLTDKINIVKRADGLPPSLYGAGWLEVENNDTLFYTFAGIQNITASGDTIVTNDFYRYNLTDHLLQQYDSISRSWGSIISIEEQQFTVSQEMNLYPNPANESINITIGNNQGIETVKIFNRNGQLVRQIQRPEHTEFNIAGFAAGLYFVRVDSGQKYYLGKFVKQ